MDGPPQGYPVTGKRSKKKGWQSQQLQPRHAPFKQQGYRPPSTQLGPFFGAVPSLEDMRQANRKQTRHHFAGSGRHKHRRPPRSTPKSIPRAPEHHPVAFPPGANPLDTPAPEIAAFPVAADKLEAEGLNSSLDFYGTNEGMLFRNRAADSGSEQSELEGASGDEDDYAHAPAHTSLAGRLAEQEAYISNLEDENLRLRERLEMLQQELNDLRHGRDPEQADSADAPSPSSSQDRSIAHTAAAPAPSGGVWQQRKPSARLKHAAGGAKTLVAAQAAAVPVSADGQSTERSSRLTHAR